MTWSDLKALEIGSHFLGSGGGEDSSNTRMMVEREARKQSVSVIPLKEIEADALVVIVSFLGCPTIEDEKIGNISQVRCLLKKIEETYSKPISALSTLSVGGGTLFFPFFIASHLNVSILDADCFGRCFPELQMSSVHLAGISPKKAFISNVMGHVFEIDCNSFQSLERHARRITVSSGGACIIVPQVLTGEEAKRGLVPGSLTKALTIGKIIQETRDLNAVMDYAKGTFVGVGGVVSSTGVGLPEPFKRRVVFRNTQTRKVWEVLMDNEYSMLFENGKVIAEVPDIIALCDPYTCEPLTVNHLKRGANVAICAMKAPDVWYTERGLALAQNEVYRQGRAALSVLPSLELLERIA